MQMTGGQAVAAQLEREGVEVIFGLPGDQLMHLLDGLHGSSIDFIVTRHEQGTTYLADGYARAGGRPGVAMSVPGVGVYNAASGLATAYACSSPVFQLAGQVNRHGIGKDLGLLHDVHDQLDLVSPITKRAERVLDVAAIAPAINASFGAMRSGRPRPTHVEIPPETLGETGAVTLLEPMAASPTQPDPDLVDRAADLLAASTEPVVIAGGGVNLADASAELAAVAQHLQASVLTTREGKGAFDDRDPLSVGTMWVNSRLRPVIDGADVVLAVGTRLQGFGFAAGQQIIHVDADATELGKQVEGTTEIAGDARLTLAALADALDRRGPARASRADERRAARQRVVEGLRAVGPQAAMVETLREAIPDEAVVVAGTTTMGYMCHMHLPMYEPRTYLSSSYMGTLGFAYPVGLGAKVGRPDRPVVTVIGDGGFLFAATELATAVQHGINTVTLVFNDGAYGNSNRDQREKFGGREIGTQLRNPDFAALAQSFGADGVKVGSVDDLLTVVPEAVANDRPTVIEIPMTRLPSPF